MSRRLEAGFAELIAAEVAARPQQVHAAAELLAEGATVPFIARYRKEATGGLTDEQLETLAKRREYFLELADRRDAILESIAGQGKLTPELEAEIRAATAKQQLEDLYLPYKPKRRTRAQIAREQGLEPLADELVAAAIDPAARPEALAGPFVDAGREVAGAAAALAGARDVLAERLAEDAGVRAAVRQVLGRRGTLRVSVVPGREETGAVYRDWFEHEEPLATMPSHRLLAVLRGEREGVLLTDVVIDDAAQVEELGSFWKRPLDTPCGRQLAEATADGYKRLLRPSLTHEVRAQALERAEGEAIRVFRDNLAALLMQAPLGQVPVMGLDPGLRTERLGLAAAGTVADGDGVHPVRKALAGREDLGRVIVAIVPETGASVYSASPVAREELPDLDVSIRGAGSIARRLQDPLAELVKIEPKSLGVGQYQHDVDQRGLARELDLTVEGVVHKVGVELNTASPSLLKRVSGISERLAAAIVAHRDQAGPFPSRKALLRVPGLGPKTFELAAGFLRLRSGEHPLDKTGVHPERYAVVEDMAAELGVAVDELVGSPALVARVDFGRFAGRQEGLGLFTLEDIKTELERPGRDPRPDFATPEWREDVTSVADLEPGMVLEGRVSNVTNFGAFVDVGVKRDGLVHVSELSTRWIDDPRQAVQVGQIVKVKVLEVDRQRERISLSIKQL